MKKASLTPTPLPRIAHFEKLGYGLFLHWGLYSQLGRGEWVMHREKIAARTYKRLTRTFTAADFDARAWARFAREAGMRYITLTSRHHEGFSLYDTRGLSDFDAPHSAAKRDLIAEFVTACREEGIAPFLYHTTLDWQWDTQHCDEPKFQKYLDYLHASVEVLCRNYGPIGGLWFDGNWSRPKADWKEDRLYALIRRHQPDTMIINNTGLGAEGALGHSEIDCTTFEQGLPRAPDRRGWKKYLAGEMCQTMNAHWGVGAHDLRYLSLPQIIENLALCRKVGANYLLNVGPTAQGGIPDFERATLLRAGEWTRQNEAALGSARPAPEIKCPGRDFMLRAGRKYYYFAFDLPIAGDDHVTAVKGAIPQRAFSGLSEKIRSARWLDSGEKLSLLQNPRSGHGSLDLIPFSYGTHLVVRVAELQT